jgi:hypothetical protein
MVFVDSNDFKIEDFGNAMNGTDEKYLPNIICLLDKGVIVKAKIVKQETLNSLGPIEIYPEFINNEDKNEFKWVFLKFGTLDMRSAANFAFLIFALNNHLKKCLVLRPEILNYFNTMFNHNGQIIE